MFTSLLMMVAMPAILVGLGFMLRSKQGVFEKQLQLGLAHLKSGEPAEAEIHFRAALLASPGQLKSSYTAAMQAFTLRQYHAAAPLFYKCVEFAPGFYECWLRYAYCLARMAQPVTAIEAYQRAMRVRPNKYPEIAYAQFHEAISFGLQEKHPEAITIFNEILERRPNAIEVLYERACCFAMANRLPAAAADLKQVLDLDSDYSKDAEEDWRLKNLRAAQEDGTLNVPELPRLSLALNE